MHKRRLFLPASLCMIFLISIPTTTRAIPQTYIGPYQVDLGNGLVLHMTDDFSLRWDDDTVKPSGLYQDGELVYAIEQFMPQDSLAHITADGLHFITFSWNYRDHWMLSDQMGPDGSIGTFAMYSMGVLVNRFEVAGLWFSPGNSRWYRDGDETLHVVGAGVWRRRELTISLSDHSVLSERWHFNLRPFIRGARTIVLP